MRRLGDFQIVDGLKTVEEVDARREAVAVVERGRPDVGVRLRVDAAAKVGIGIGATFHRRREGRKDGVAPVDLRIAIVGLGNAHFRGVLHGIAHTFFEGHGSGVLGLDHIQGPKRHHQNEKGMFSFHLTYI